MANLLHLGASVAHLLAAVAAMATGTYILLWPKGTPMHRQVGWAYAASMAALLLTAFRMYFIFGRFGIVHWGAVGSAVCLLVGIGAVLLRQVVPARLSWHYYGMGGSVTGLYAAFAAEGTYRFFALTYFWWATLGPAIAVFAAGGALLHRHYPAWKADLRPALPGR